MQMVQRVRAPAMQVMASLGDTNVPVPKALCLCTDPVIIGTPFYVMQHVQVKTGLPIKALKKMSLSFLALPRTTCSGALVYSVEVSAASHVRPREIHIRACCLWTGPHLY